jgi:hypothetical protein
MKIQPVFAALLALLGAAPGAASGPAQNLWVEVRWVDSAVSGAVVAGVSTGATVVGTAGSISSRGGAGISTQRRDEQQVQRLLVLNGHQASVRMTEQTPVQWLDFGVQFDTGSANPGAGANRGWAVPRNGVTEQTQGFSVTPHWPGGQQPVRVELRAEGSGGGSGAGAVVQAQSQSQAEVLSTVSVALGQWLTVARSGAAMQRQERGVISSRSAEAQTARELQLRVDLAP